jgi:hypothetical protein
MTTLPSSSASLSVLLAIAEGGLYVRYRYVGIDVNQVVNNTKEKAKKKCSPKFTIHVDDR